MTAPWSSRKLLVAVYFQHVWVLLVTCGILYRTEHAEAFLRTFEGLTVVTIGGYFVGNVGEWWAKRS